MVEAKITVLRSYKNHVKKCKNSTKNSKNNVKKYFITFKTILNFTTHSIAPFKAENAKQTLFFRILGGLSKK